MRLLINKFHLLLIMRSPPLFSLLSSIIIFSLLRNFIIPLLEMGNNKRERRQRAQLARVQISSAPPLQQERPPLEIEQPTSGEKSLRPQMDLPLPKTLHVEPVITQYFPSDRLKDMLQKAESHRSHGDSATALKLYEELYPLALQEQGLNDLFTLRIVGSLTTLYCEKGGSDMAFAFLMSRGPNARCG